MKDSKSFLVLFVTNGFVTYYVRYGFLLKPVTLMTVLDISNCVVNINFVLRKFWMNRQDSTHPLNLLGFLTTEP